MSSFTPSLEDYWCRFFPQPDHQNSASQSHAMKPRQYPVLWHLASGARGLADASMANEKW
jgi:hypothetical protein